MSNRDKTVQDHLSGKDESIISLYRRFVKLIEACGSFKTVVGKDGIAFKGQRRNFAVAKPKIRGLDGVLVLPRQLKDPRIRATEPFTKQLIGNRFHLTELNQLDEEFAHWVREAYQVGQGQRLEE